MPDDALAVVRGVSKTYATPSGGIEALHEVDADVHAGEIAAIVGASGSGKSTLLRALAGLDRPNGGSLRIAGRELADAAPGELRRHRREVATYVAQKAADNLVPHLTVREHDPSAAPLLAEFGLGHRLEARPIELSGGEQARAAFALALARGTPLLLADEPTAELDTGSSAALLAAIREHAGAGAAVVIATHDEEVMAIADRVLRLDRGRVAAAAAAPPAGRTAARGEPGDAILRARGVTRSFRRGPEQIHAVAGATLELGRGEIGALLGRSGSGKSTLLMLLAGMQRPDTGEIAYAIQGGGADPAGLPWSELAFLPQRFGLLPELSVRENVSYSARLAGALGDYAARVEALLDRLGLAELADRLPQETSIGQQQRTALARALTLAPAVLLADEPTSHQDASFRDRVWHVLVDAAEAGTACLVATHEREIARYATRVWLMDGGAVAAA